ncbi:MAG: secretin N-terminal domain-containing protein, partial [Deltaproteobacteria bacterium]
MKLRLFVLLCAGFFHLFTPVVAGGAEKKAPATGNKISLDFKDVDLPDFIKTISEFTGKNFIFDETVRGKVTVISPQSVTRQEAYQIFLSVLNVKGYTVVPSGEVNKIVLLAAAKDSNLPMLTDSSKLARGEQYVTYLLPLENIDVSDIATSLAALVPKTGSIVAFPPTNTLIITDSAANIERLIQLLHKLDVPDNNEVLEVIGLQYVAADEMAKLVTQVMREGGSKAAPRIRGRARRQAPVQTAGGGQESEKIIPFTPTNVLVVKASADEIETIKSIVAKLDQKPTQTRAGIHVYYLEKADAETLAKTMKQILTGIKTQTGAPAASRVAKGAPPAKTQALEGVSITADKPTNSLVINSTPEEYETVRAIIKQLDIKRKQVYVEALILELSMDATKK